MTAPAIVTVTLADEAATAALMADLALLLGPGDLVTLSGDLGAGKTTAARALIRYLASDDALDVPSPTFTLVQSYDLPAGPVLHADLYRIADPSELDEIGLSPLPDDVLTLIEWPERAGGVLPEDRIDIALSLVADGGEGTRAARIVGTGAGSAKVRRLAGLRRFLEAAGLSTAARQRMAGDASTRSYARLGHNGESLILMNAPRRPDGPALYGGRSYSAAVHLAEDVRPFVAMAQALRAAGVSAPAIHHADLDLGLLVTEDFGREGVLAGDPPEPDPDRYAAATDLLARLHGRALPARVPVAGEGDYEIPEFGREAMLIEIGLMPEWYLPDRGAPLNAAAQSHFFALWRDLLDRHAGDDPTWVLRDYHSPNLIWLPQREGPARVGVIDFQDAVIGPAAYDLVSLLQDARVDVPEALELSLFARYVQARRGRDEAFDAARCAESYAVMSAQRNTRLLGTFARLNRRDGKPHYLRHQPRAWTYLMRSLAHPALAELRAWFAAHVPPPA